MSQVYMSHVLCILDKNGGSKASPGHLKRTCVLGIGTELVATAAATYWSEGECEIIGRTVLDHLASPESVSPSGGRSCADPGFPLHPDGLAHRGNQRRLRDCHPIQGTVELTSLGGDAQSEVHILEVLAQHLFQSLRSN